MIHDAVRPFVSKNLIHKLIKETKNYSSVIPGILINDTVKRTDKNFIVRETISREYLYSIQTPQVFRYDILVKSFEKAYEENYIGTDEAAIVEYAEYKIKLIEGENSNIKVTIKEDLRNLNI
jgi:2-C-methyl-D-erythritol 4-phosphate cytidylyltransferase